MKIHNALKSVVFILIFSNTCNAQYRYPATKTVDSSDTYFGVTYKDPYRWLEHMKDTEVVTWFKDQADLSNSILNKISGRDELIAEWKMLDSMQPPFISAEDYENSRIFYRKLTPGDNVSKLYYRRGLNGKEELLFDPKSYIPGKTLSILNFLPSFDGQKIAIAYSEAGKEISTIKVMDVDTKSFLPESLYPTYGANSWTFDNKAFLYYSFNTGDNTNIGLKLNTKTKLHKLGEDEKNDIDFFSDSSYPNLGIKPNEHALAYLRKDSPDFIFADVSNVRNEKMTYYAPLSEFSSGKVQWRVLCRPEDGIVRGMEIIENDVFAITYKDAKNYKLVHTSLTHPDWNNADIIVAEMPDHTLESITHSKDYLFARFSDGINSYIYKYRFATEKTSQIVLPYSGAAFISCFDEQTNDCVVGISSWNKPYTEFGLNAETDMFSPSIFNKPAEYPNAYKDLQVDEVEVKGHDGVMIPLSIVYRKGLKKDGSSVCLLQGYGAYGTNITPRFNNLYNALVVQGVITAIAHVRGGSEKGEDWHKAGYKTTKPNTWKDFNSCAEYLIDHGYTSKSKLAGMGTSAGGILISRAITERPDLFGAAICNVGCANAMRLEFSPNGPPNIPEFGTVRDSVECRALFEMDGLQHVKVGTNYPAVICVGGWNDPRVSPWEPGKFAAALQNASSSSRPVLMKVNYNNGHFTEDRSVTFADFADMLAFALWQCGDSHFKMK